MENLQEPLVLVVDDDSALAKSLGEHFYSHFRVQTTSDYANLPALAAVEKAELIIAPLNRSHSLPPLPKESAMLWVMAPGAAPQIPRSHQQIESADFIGHSASKTEWLLRAGNLIRLHRSADTVRRRDEFLSLVAHEIKTPLSSASLQLQILDRQVNVAKSEQPDSQYLKDAIDLSLRQMQSMGKLIDDLLDVARIQLGKLPYHRSEVHLSSLIHDITLRYRESLERGQVKLTLDVDPHIVGNWDEQRIEQVFVNLVSNIVKYAPKTEAKISAHLTADSAEIQVEDHGPGIAPESQARLFDRFERAAPRGVSGLGLGLYIVKRIIDRHGGDIQIQSRLGLGTCFKISLPLAERI
jgi:signal transduction histidine kinase